MLSRVDVTQRTLITLFIGLCHRRCCHVRLCPQQCLLWSSPVSFIAAGLLVLPLCACVCFQGCRMPCEVCWSRTRNFESSRQEGKRARIRGGPEEEKHSHVRQQTEKRKGGAGALGFCVFVSELMGCLKEKNRAAIF